VELRKETTVKRIVIDEAGYDRVRKFELQVSRNGAWETFLKGTKIGALEREFEPVTGQRFRLNITEATEVPTINMFQLME
jgi:hypothetical protein